MTEENGSANAGDDGGQGPWAEYRALWDEYKYRHDLIWQRTFTFTTAITLISTIPYIRPQIAAQLGNYILIAPLLAYFLAFFGLLVMMNELALFGKIKKAYRKRQGVLIDKKLHSAGRWDEFRIFVTGYFLFLLVLCVLNFYVVRQVWLPGVACACP
jgi:hypothetical protein